MQERAKISRRQILQGAADRFEVTGYGSTSMNDIVSAAQMTKGAVYFHFSSKDELAQAGDRRTAPDLDQCLHRSCSHRRTGTGTARHGVPRDGPPTRRRAYCSCGNPTYLELASADGSQGPYVAWIRELRKLAEAAKLEGDIRDDVEPESVGRVVISAFTGVQLVSNVLTRRSDLNDRIDELFTLLLAGVVSDKRRSAVAELVGCRLETYAS